MIYLDNDENILAISPVGTDRGREAPEEFPTSREMTRNVVNYPKARIQVICQKPFVPCRHVEATSPVNVSSSSARMALLNSSAERFEVKDMYTKLRF